MRCPRMDAMPVVTEWQTKIYCPNCKHYSTGQCNNPARKNNDDPCPMKNVEPIEYADVFNRVIGQKVVVKPQNVEGKIINRQLSNIGVLYEIETENDRFWITEDHLG